jgi:hypothetical protein
MTCRMTYSRAVLSGIVRFVRVERGARFVVLRGATMRRLLAGAVVGSILLLLLALPVLAAELTGGCVIEVRSFDGPNATGRQVDEGRAQGVIAEGAVGSQSRPFKVDPDGSVDFLFTTGTVFENNHWAIFAEGIPVALLAGSDDNPMDLDETGVVSIGEAVKKLPFAIVGTFFITGDLYGNLDASHCHGEGYVQVLGDAVGTPLWILAAALIALGGLGILVAVPYTEDWEVDATGGERLHTGPITGPPPGAP